MSEKITLAGLDYRQWLIGQAIAGICSSPLKITAEMVASAAINTADAILDALEKEQGTPKATVVAFQAKGTVQCTACLGSYNPEYGQSDTWKLFHISDGKFGRYVWQHRHGGPLDDIWYEAVEVAQ